MVVVPTSDDREKIAELIRATVAARRVGQEPPKQSLDWLARHYEYLPLLPKDVRDYLGERLLCGGVDDGLWLWALRCGRLIEEPHVPLGLSVMKVEDPFTKSTIEMGCVNLEEGVPVFGGLLAFSDGISEHVVNRTQLSFVHLDKRRCGDSYIQYTVPMVVGESHKNSFVGLIQYVPTSSSDPWPLHVSKRLCRGTTVYKNCQEVMVRLLTVGRLISEVKNGS